MMQTFDAESAYKELSKHFHERVRRDELLARHCTFGVGGPADVWVSVDSRDDLISLVRLSIERRWPLLLVGNGTNVLYADAGVRGIVARNTLSNYTIEEMGDSAALLVAGSGVGWPRWLAPLTALGWGGLVFGPAFPGTLGGGVLGKWGVLTA